MMRKLGFYFSALAVLVIAAFAFAAGNSNTGLLPEGINAVTRKKQTGVTDYGSLVNVAADSATKIADATAEAPVIVNDSLTFGFADEYKVYTEDSQTTQAGNIDGGSDLLMAVTIPVTAFGADGDSVAIEAGFFTAANGNNKTILARIEIGSGGMSTIYTTTAVAANAKSFFYDLRLVRHAGTFVIFSSPRAGDSGFSAIQSCGGSYGAGGFADPVHIRFYGEGTATNDVVQGWLGAFSRRAAAP